MTIFGAATGAVAGEPRMMAMTMLNKPVIPARAADGAFRTINHGIDAQQALWHVRAAINVAALGCEGAGRQATIAAYNRFLTSARAPLDAANRTIVARYKAQYGAAWTGQYDAYMTSLYNFFSQPFVKTAFCAAAQPIAAETAGVTAQSAAAFAVGALPRLEAPFTDFYKRYAAYEQALADYNGRYAGGRAAGAPPPPVSPLLDYAALDVGDDWQPKGTTAPVTVASDAIAARPAASMAPIRLAAATPVSAPPRPTRYTMGPFVIDGPPPALPPAMQSPAAPPQLDYHLPN